MPSSQTGSAVLSTLPSATSSEDTPPVRPNPRSRFIEGALSSTSPAEVAVSVTLPTKYTRILSLREMTASCNFLCNDMPTERYGITDPVSSLSCENASAVTAPFVTVVTSPDVSVVFNSNLFSEGFSSAYPPAKSASETDNSCVYCVSCVAAPESPSAPSTTIPDGAHAAKNSNAAANTAAMINAKVVFLVLAVYRVVIFTPGAVTSSPL